MNATKGIFRNGQIVFEPPADWPEGMEVRIEPVPEQQNPGIREEDWPETPEAMAEWLAWYDALEPLEHTPAEQAEIALWRRKTKEFTIAHMNQNVDGLFP